MISAVAHLLRLSRAGFVLARAGVEQANFSGIVEGHLVESLHGTRGFGYDPLFFSDELSATFGEASLPAKQRVSHRGRAIRALIEVLVRRSQ